MKKQFLLIALIFISQIIFVSQKDEILNFDNSIVYRAKVLVEKMGLAVGIFLNEKDNTPPWISSNVTISVDMLRVLINQNGIKNEGPHLWDPSNLTNQQPY